ncbi:hypothetical protein A2907_01420 [Candidatus Azambacteria bacterium RIFCSPLOWO2_01_FULL_37_9]|uniref:YoaR-like putative peptidoglycan binding domain-containing protein n=1 Tax=Candidatus Azambacteria bacterium RIFCSPLOWO2_01_FULL_37_9 TaxID=1797297 RepID=A0A1F5C7G1_9BACT|nr:MAG: hypothetical protein A2907_01420 [Candidatus Azambacteria bacterium RIFCSPLOWO2_01_FULL_37_9]
MIKLIKKTLLYLAISCVSVVFLSAVFIGAINAQKIVFGIKIAGINVGGMNPNDARERLERAVDDFLSQKIILKIGEKRHETTFNNLGVKLDAEKSVESVFAVGRKGNFLVNFYEQLGTLLKGRNFDMIVDFDDEKTENYLKNFKSYEKDRRDASVYFDDMAMEFKAQYSNSGNMIDRGKLKRDIKELAGNLNTGERIVPFIAVYPEATDEMADDALVRANDLLIKHPGINLLYNNNFWPVDKKTIGGWIGFELSRDKNFLDVRFAEDKTSEYLTQISQNINQEPVDAVLVQKGGRVEAFTLSRDGRYINVKNSSTEILATLDGLGKSVELEMDKVKAKIDTNEIENLGLTSLLATGSSDFSGSPSNRVHNIKIGAAKFNGIMLAPKEEFSFVKILGEVGPEEGYLPELVIKTNKTVPEYGGGICQVSTTAFRAAILTGLEIRERYPHSFPVKYYSPQGFDAAIYPPSPDLKFVNDTPSNLLIQTKIKGAKLYFEFYGTDDGRKVVLTGPEEYDKNPDGSMKAKLTRDIFDKDNNLIRTTVFRSNYKSPDLYPVVRNPLE